MQIKKLIKSNFFLNKKDIRLDNFIKYLLFSKYGYYYNQNPIGKQNDFITAPEISQMFGEIIGLYLLYTWKTKINSKYNLIELGPGTGTLFKDIIKSVSNYQKFINQAKISLIEINKKLIQVQKNNIKKNFQNTITWRKSINFNSKLPSVIYSNEFFDCFPVRQFVRKDNWYEKYINFDDNDDRFYFKDKLVKNKKLLYNLNLFKKVKLLEISFERNKYFEKICKFIKNNGGIILTIDYGYFNPIENFTLQAIQNHKYSNVLEEIGEKDISSHVNFKDLIDIAIKNKLKIDEFCTQKEFLLKYGVLEREKKLSKFNNAELINNELMRLIDDNEMGKLFKCLIVSNL